MSVTSDCHLWPSVNEALYLLSTLINNGNWRLTVYFFCFFRDTLIAKLKLKASIVHCDNFYCPGDAKGNIIRIMHLRVRIILKRNYLNMLRILPILLYLREIGRWCSELFHEMKEIIENYRRILLKKQTHIALNFFPNI